MVSEEDVREAIAAHLSDAEVNVTDISNGCGCVLALREDLCLLLDASFQYMTPEHILPPWFPPDQQVWHRL